MAAHSHKKDHSRIIKIAIVLSCLGLGGLGVFYGVLPHLQRVEPVVFQGDTKDYVASFFTQDGRKITEVEGRLRLVTDPFTVYRNAPNQRTASYQVDDAGFRRTTGATGVKKAFVLGGSATFGQGLDRDEDTLTSRLNHYARSYQFLNAGVVGFLSGQELALMVHYLDDAHPDLYVIFDGWNDVYDPYMWVNKWPVGRAPWGFMNVFFKIEDRLAQYHEEKVGHDVAVQQRFAVPEKTRGPDEYFERACGVYQSNLEKMNAFARARGAKLLVVFQPELGAKKTKTKDEQNSLIGWERVVKYEGKDISGIYAKFRKRALTFCATSQIACLDLNEAPTFTDHPKRLYFDPVHLTPLGYDRAAKVIAKRIQSL
jgi:hypothetical protein